MTTETGPIYGRTSEQHYQREISSLVIECGRYSTCLLAASQRLNVNSLMEVPNAIDALIAERDRLRRLLHEFTSQPFAGGPYYVMMSVPVELLNRMQQEVSP